jgi:hypothetical protein
MKIFSAVSATALLLGIGAFMHPTTAKAVLPTGYCPTLYADCKVGDQEACAQYDALCTGDRPSSIVSGVPSAKSHGKPEGH